VLPLAITTIVSAAQEGIGSSLALVGTLKRGGLAHRANDVGDFAPSTSPSRYHPPPPGHHFGIMGSVECVWVHLLLVLELILERNELLGEMSNADLVWGTHTLGNGNCTSHATALI